MLDDEAGGEVNLFPRWRQAVRDFLDTFNYGDLVSHDWLEEHFGMPKIADAKRLTQAEFRDRQFDWLANVEAFKAALLHEHQVLLQSVRGEGYRWAPPGEQTAIASKEFERDVKRGFRLAGQRLKNIRADVLTDDQRREHRDAVAKVAALRGMTRKALR